MRRIAAIGVLLLAAGGFGQEPNEEDKRQPNAPESERYRPLVKGMVEAERAPLAQLFRQLPGVSSVDVCNQCPKPRLRIVHLKDWHYVPRDLFAADIRSASQAEYSDEDVDRLYAEFLAEVEQVQIEQAALLRCLIRHHGLTCVFQEGLTEEDLPIYRAKIRVLKSLERQLPALRRQLESVTTRLAAASAPNQTAQLDDDELPEEQRQLEQLLETYRQERLQIGAAGQLLMSGELKEVRPLDDFAAWQAADPLKPNGSVRLSNRLIEAREDAQLKQLLAGGGFALIVLGGGHDLSDNIARLAETTCQYITVETRRARSAGRDAK